MTPAQILKASNLLATLAKLEAELKEFQTLAFSDYAKREANKTGSAGILMFTTGTGMQAIFVPPNAAVLGELEKLYEMRVVEAKDRARAAGVTI